jgi:hypothetical protein
MGERRSVYRFVVGKRAGRRMFGRLWVGGRIKWFLNKLDVMVWTVVIWVRLGASGGLLSTRNFGGVK